MPMALAVGPVVFMQRIEKMIVPMYEINSVHRGFTMYSIKAAKNRPTAKTVWPIVR